MVYACSCTNDHIPLEDAICRADTTGTIVLAVTLRRHLDGNAAELRIDEVLVGQTDKETLTVGALHSCAWYISQEPVGQRYLYFYWPESYGEYEGDLFGCAYYANIYRLNRQGTEVEYSYTASGGYSECRAPLPQLPQPHRQSEMWGRSSRHTTYQSTAQHRSRR